MNKRQEPVFIYARRSTRNKQDLSLDRQEDSAHETVFQNGYKIEDVNFYTESLSAYNGIKIRGGKIIRKRTEFQRMLDDIDKSPVPVTLLTYEPSRLSRNDYDSQAILDRLFQEYNSECGKIGKIIFNGGEKWDDTNLKSDIKNRLLKSYTESETIQKRTTRSMIGELRKGRYVLTTPKGINRLKPKENELRINDLMPYIYKAWEMKAEWKKRIEIDAYLRSHGIKISASYEEYFQTLIYTGFWLDPETGKLIPQKFLGGKAPISMDLYNRVQLTLKKSTGKKMTSKYGDKQKGDILSGLMKWENDKTKSFSVEFAKGKHPSYKNNAYGGFNKSQNKILDIYMEQGVPILRVLINKILFLFTLKKGVTNEIFAIQVRKMLSDMDKLPDNDKWDYFATEISKSLHTTGVWEEAINKLESKDAEYMNEFCTLLKIYFDEVGRTNSIIDTKERDNLLITLHEQREEKLKERKDTPLKYAKLGYDKDTAQLAIDEIDAAIAVIDNDISSLSTSTDMEEFVMRLPEVILKIFELSSKVLSNKEVDTFRGDILKLIELTTFELSVSTKKELTVKLFAGLENLLSGCSFLWLPELDSNQGPTG